MPTDEEIDRRLLEFAQKIAAIPKEIATEAFAGSSAEAATDGFACPLPAEVDGQSLPPPLHAGKQPDPDIRPPRPPTQAAGRFATQKKLRASS